MTILVRMPLMISDLMSLQLLWGYMPRLSEFSAIPALDMGLEESEVQVGPFAVGLLVGKGHFAEVSQEQQQRVSSLSYVPRPLDADHSDDARIRREYPGRRALPATPTSALIL